MLDELTGHFVKATELPGFITEFKEARLVIAGVPIERYPTIRRGTLLAPSRIREVLNYIETLSPYSGLDIIDMKFHDLGDLVLNTETLEKQQSMIENLFYKVLAAGKKVGLLGGDRTVLSPIFNALKKKHPDAGLVVFDGHLDLCGTASSDRFSHTRVLNEVLYLHPETAVLHIGSRAITRTKRRTIEKIIGKVMAVSVLEFQMKKMTDVKKKVTDFFDIHQGKIHVSIDMDCFDPSSAPGVTKPKYPGLTAQQVFRALHWIKNEVISFDLCDFTPSHDADGTTAVLAAKTFCELMYKTEARPRG